MLTLLKTEEAFHALATSGTGDAVVDGPDKATARVLEDFLSSRISLRHFSQQVMEDGKFDHFLLRANQPPEVRRPKRGTNGGAAACWW